MKIGILGSGNVGGTLGKRWAKGGHTVMFTSRDPKSEEMKKLLAEAGASASAGSISEAVRASDVIVIALPWAAVKGALQGAGDFSGKVVVDATNPVRANLAGLEIGTTTSAAEQVANWVTGAKVVKAFNTVGYNIMENPKFDARSAVMLYCGDDAESKKAVGQLATELGFDAKDAGPLTQARLLEPFALLGITLAYVAGQGRGIGFQLVERA